MSTSKRMQITGQMGIVVVVLSVAALAVVSAPASAAVSEPSECNVVEYALGTQVARNSSEAALSDTESVGQTTDEGSISDPALLVLGELTTLLDQSSRSAPTIVDGRLQASCEMALMYDDMEYDCTKRGVHVRPLCEYIAKGAFVVVTTVGNFKDK